MQLAAGVLDSLAGDQRAAEPAPAAGRMRSSRGRGRQTRGRGRGRKDEVAPSADPYAFPESAPQRSGSTDPAAAASDSSADVQVGKRGRGRGRRAASRARGRTSRQRAAGRKSRLSKVSQAEDAPAAEQSHQQPAHAPGLDPVDVATDAPAGAILDGGMSQPVHGKRKRQQSRKAADMVSMPALGSEEDPGFEAAPEPTSQPPAKRPRRASARSQPKQGARQAANAPTAAETMQPLQPEPPASPEEHHQSAALPTPGKHGWGARRQRSKYASNEPAAAAPRDMPNETASEPVLASAPDSLHNPASAPGKVADPGSSDVLHQLQAGLESTAADAHPAAAQPSGSHEGDEAAPAAPAAGAASPPSHTHAAEEVPDSPLQPDQPVQTYSSRKRGRPEPEWTLPETPAAPQSSLPPPRKMAKLSKSQLLGSRAAGNLPQAEQNNVTPALPNPIESPATGAVLNPLPPAPLQRESSEPSRHPARSGAKQRKEQAPLPAADQPSRFTRGAAASVGIEHPMHEQEGLEAAALEAPAAQDAQTASELPAAEDLQSTPAADQTPAGPAALPESQGPGRKASGRRAPTQRKGTPREGPVALKSDPRPSRDLLTRAAADETPDDGASHPHSQAQSLKAAGQSRSTQRQKNARVCHWTALWCHIHPLPGPASQHGMKHSGHGQAHSHSRPSCYLIKMQPHFIKCYDMIREWLAILLTAFRLADASCRRGCIWAIGAY